MLLNFSLVSGSRCVAIGIMLIAAFLLCPVVEAADVVILHSTDNGTAWTDEIDKGLVFELGDEANVVSIFLGAPNNDEDYFDARFEALSQQWGDRSPSAVITDGETAFAFMRKYREDLFVASPVIYCGMERPSSVYLSQCGECTGLPLEYDVEKTVDLIFQLRPETSVVVGIMDGSQQSAGLRRRVEAVMEQYLETAQVLFPGHEPGDDSGLDMETLKSVASSTPRLGAVLFLGMAVDSAGNTVNELEAIQLLTQRSDGPVYVLSDQWFGQGVIGGVVIGGEAQGRAVGALVKRVLSGDSIRNMLPETVSAKPMVDLTVLTQRGLSSIRLPSDVVKVNAPERPEELASVDSTGIVVLGAALFAGGLIFALLRRSANRKDT